MTEVRINIPKYFEEFHELVMSKFEDLHKKIDILIEEVKKLQTEHERVEKSDEINDQQNNEDWGDDENNK